MLKQLLNLFETTKDNIFIWCLLGFICLLISIGIFWQLFTVFCFATAIILYVASTYEK